MTLKHGTSHNTSLGIKLYGTKKKLTKDKRIVIFKQRLDLENLRKLWSLFVLHIFKYVCWVFTFLTQLPSSGSCVNFLFVVRLSIIPFQASWNVSLSFAICETLAAYAELHLHPADWKLHAKKNIHILRAQHKIVSKDRNANISYSYGNKTGWVLGLGLPNDRSACLVGVF